MCVSMCERLYKVQLQLKKTKIGDPEVMGALNWTHLQHYILLQN